MAEQSTTMVLKVDLQCGKCTKKVKKALCKIPEIRDQLYDEKNNTVTIKVVSGCPEKIKRKILRKGGKSVECIEIKPPEQEKPKEPEPKAKEKEPEEPEKPSEPEKSREPQKHEESPPPAPPVMVPCIPATGYPPPYPNPMGSCCRECYEGRVGGPCEQLGCGRPQCCDGYYGRPVYDSWGGGGGYGNRFDYSYCEAENSSACTIM